ncbi:MAG TPA: MraY family glycosyltransferase [Bacteroidales bacterium]|nr:MraY family glycosyltransferase [Bacteroidales bacterium]
MENLLSVSLAFVVAAFITWYYIPRIVSIVKKLQLVDKPANHKIHKLEIPTLGGIGIIAGFAFGFLIAVNGYVENVPVLALVIIGLLFTGLKDDLIHVNPWTKFLEIILLTSIVVLMTDLRFTSLHGFMGISDLPLWISCVLTIFIMVLIINSVNLIDGIDGLAASVGIVASLSFGIWFWLSDDYGYAVMSAALLGSLIAFLPFNISGGQRKIFMGDTGSLAIGFILAVFAIRFNELDASDKTFHDFYSAPTVSIAILILPLFDTLRIIVLRLYHKHSLFTADNRHIHHLMLQAGFSHRMTTLLLTIFNVIIIIVALLLDHLGILWLGLILLLLCILADELVRFRIRRKMSQKTNI